MNDNKEGLETKRGYLEGDFEFFHLKDKRSLQFEFHYHDFNKIIIFLSGKVTYLIEGKAYNLKPWDILLVNSREVHKPMIDPAETYERIVLWVNPAFLEKHSNSSCSLLTCFELAMSKKYNLLRPDPESLKMIKYILFQLEDACRNNDFGSAILKNSVFIQLIVHFNRQFLGAEIGTDLNDTEYDENIGLILNYINENLREELSIDDLASRFYISKYYLMHKFKKQTGYSVHNYILQKRLILANSLIKKGNSLSDISTECGFGDYSSFVRSFKKMFGFSPKKHQKNLLELQKQVKNNHF